MKPVTKILTKFSLLGVVFVMGSCDLNSNNKNEEADEPNTPAVCDHEYGEWVKINGTSHKQVCSLCGDTINEDHCFDDGVETKKATHFEKGITTYTCTKCHYTKTEDIDVIPHVFTSFEYIDSDYHLRKCECGYSEPVLHKFNEGIITTPSTHTISGVKTFTCTECNYFYTVNLGTTDEHTYGEWIPNNEESHKKVCECGDTVYGSHRWNNGEITLSPTHLTKGVKTFTCLDCGQTKTEDVETTTEHSFENWQSDGSNSHSRSCACGEVETESHVWDQGVTSKPSTHLEKGQKKFTCTKCGEIKYEEIATTTEHSFGSWTSEDANNHIHSCECGEVEREAHKWGTGEVVLEPTHLQLGRMKYTCTVCGQEKFEDIAKLSGHTYGDWTKLDLNNHAKYCACGDYVTEPHNWNSGTITENPTETKEGTKQLTCTVCGQTKNVGVSGYNIVSSSIFSGITPVKEQISLYSFNKTDLDEKAYLYSFETNENYPFVDADISDYDVLFFYYQNAGTIYPEMHSSNNSSVVFKEMSTSLSDNNWHLFEIRFDHTKKCWNISSDFFNLTNAEFTSLSEITLKTGGSNPKMYFSQLFGYHGNKHTCIEHTLEGSEYIKINDCCLNLSSKSISYGENNILLPNKFVDKSNYYYTSSQTTDIRFNDINEDLYDQLVFYFRAMDNNDSTKRYFEIGTVASGAYNDIFAGNSTSWNEVEFVRTSDSSFDVRVNGIKKNSVESLENVHVKSFHGQLITGLYGIKATEKHILINRDLTTNYQIVYKDNKYSKHSAELLARVLNTATGKSLFTATNVSSAPTRSEYKICVGKELSDLAGLDSSNVKGQNFRISTLYNSLYLYSDYFVGTNNAVKYLLKQLCGYEYYYIGTETINPITTLATYTTSQYTSNADFEIPYDVNAETRYLSGLNWENDYSYALDSGFIGDNMASNDYRVAGGWHNEIRCATDMGITLVKTSKYADSTRKHFDLTNETNIQKTATWLNDNFYSKGKKDVMFCLDDDFSWYNNVDTQNQYSPIYYNFINKVAEKLESLVSSKVSLVAVAYHTTIICPTSWVPHKGAKVSIKVYYSPSELIFASAPNSKYNNKSINMQSDISGVSSISYNPYTNMKAWESLANDNDLGLFVYIYNSLPNYFAPFDVVTNMGEYYQTFKSIGVKRPYDMGQYDQSIGTDWQRLKTYLKSKLSFDSSLDVDTLVKNFMDAYFGVASDTMYQLFNSEYLAIRTCQKTSEQSDFDKYYGTKNDRNFPLYLRGYYHSTSSKNCTLFEGTDTSLMNLYDKALSLATGNTTLINRIKLEGLALRYWYWGCNSGVSPYESKPYGCGSSFGFKNTRNETTEQIIADAKLLGVSHWGEAITLDARTSK